MSAIFFLPKAAWLQIWYFMQKFNKQEADIKRLMF